MVDRLQDIEIPPPLHNQSAISSEDINYQTKVFKRSGGKVEKIKPGMGAEKYLSVREANEQSARRMRKKKTDLKGLEFTTLDKGERSAEKRLRFPVRGKQ